jgi:hypothetical protein
MAGIDEVLERLVVDPAFRERMQTDPAAALSGYVLHAEDLEVLAATLDASEGGDHTVEQRTSKSAFLSALTDWLPRGRWRWCADGWGCILQQPTARPLRPGCPGRQDHAEDRQRRP